MLVFVLCSRKNPNSALSVSEDVKLYEVMSTKRAVCAGYNDSSHLHISAKLKKLSEDCSAGCDQEEMGTEPSLNFN